MIISLSMVSCVQGLLVPPLLHPHPRPHHHPHHLHQCDDSASIGLGKNILMFLQFARCVYSIFFVTSNGQSCVICVCCCVVCHKDYRVHCFVPTGCSWVYCMDVLVQLCNFSAAGCTTVPAMNPCTLYSVAYQPMINKYVTVHKKVSVGWGNEPIKCQLAEKQPLMAAFYGLTQQPCSAAMFIMNTVI